MDAARAQIEFGNLLDMCYNEMNGHDSRNVAEGTI
jgi:hypothetical protein